MIVKRYVTVHGPLNIRDSLFNEHAASCGGGSTNVDADAFEARQLERAAVVLDALNVFHETGLKPSELLERLHGKVTAC